MKKQIILGALLAFMSAGVDAQFREKYFWHDGFPTGRQSPLVGDFNGDKMDDAINFTRGGEGDVFVTLSNKLLFHYAVNKWHDNFCYWLETPLVGDFDGDGKDDIATFTKGNTGDVYVALSNGSSFSGDGWKWHDNFGYGNEEVAVGDVNGDGKDDLITFTKGNSGDVYVALSNGSSFIGDGLLWHDNFCYGDEIPKVGDFNGDGKADIVTFTTSSTNSVVYVALSNGNRFIGNASVWHSKFFKRYAYPGVGDFNGDRKDDILLFTQDNSGDVFVALSNGSRFTGNSKWHDDFHYVHDISYVGDFNGDRLDDICNFKPDPTGDIYVALCKRPAATREGSDGFENNEMIGLTDFVLSPNPTTEKVWINNNLSEPITNYSILSVDGKTLLEQNVGEGENITLDFSPFGKGAYFIRLYSNGNNVIKKILVE